MLIANYLLTLLNLAMYWTLGSRLFKGNLKAMLSRICQQIHHSKVKLGDKEWFDKEHLVLRNKGDQKVPYYHV